MADIEARSGSMAFLTFVTTCRGRLAHLRETLPLLVAQPDTAVVVVDYGCPEGSGDWIKTHFPMAEVVRSPESTRFEAARARNLGAAVVRSPWICFVDADTRLDADFSDRLKSLLTPGCFYRAEPRNPSTWGMAVCATADFEDVGGYDEVIQGWGKDDEDLYARFVMAGLNYVGFPGELAHPIKHSDAERVAHYDVKDHWLSESINHVYCRAKIDLMQLLHVPLDLDVRRRLYNQVHTSVLAARDRDKPMTLVLPFTTQQTRLCGPLEAKLVYTLPRPRGDGRPNNSAGSVIPRRPRRSRGEQ
jgi:glycosyltransferase involved in cell wall biosynthesis